jgi:hypothetical protein
MTPKTRSLRGSHRTGVATSIATSIALPAILLSLSGCAGSAGSATPGDDAEAATIAASFAGALSDTDGEAACNLLAATTRTSLESDSGSPCADAVTALHLPEPGEVRTSRAYGRAAQVDFTNDVAFLTLENGNWRISAAGCEQRPERPYRCQLKGD